MINSRGGAGSSPVAGYRMVLMVVWTAVIAGGLAWSVALVRDNMRENARIQARTAYEKDVLYRRWNAGHGGVYAPVSEETQPNPYLEGVKDREITSPAGRELTLVNPAYMTRQVYEMAWEESGVRGHITSLNPIRSGNTPDPWEAAALKSFEKGEQEFSSIEELGGADYMRLMRPFVTEERCLKCHARQGYQVGQIRGGISVAVPMAPLRPKAAKLTLVLALGHGLVWLVGMIFLHVGGRRLAENAEELEEANRSKELFTDILSHDLRNPTGAVLGYTEILLHDEKDDERRSLLERVRGSSQKLMEMLESAALYSKLDALDRVERKEVDLGVLVGRSVTDLEKTLEEKNVVVRGVPEAPLPAQASPLIENVFSNLLSNAVKFSPEEGSVEILSEEVDGSWVVAFRDHGPGIPPELRARLFTRFERLDSERAEGIGLGLAIARRLVELHRGAIWVEETPGGGSTFFVRLPKEG